MARVSRIPELTTVPQHSVVQPRVAPGVFPLPPNSGLAIPLSYRCGTSTCVLVECDWPRPTGGCSHAIPRPVRDHGRHRCRGPRPRLAHVRRQVDLLGAEVPQVIRDRIDERAEGLPVVDLGEHGLECEVGVAVDVAAAHRGFVVEGAYRFERSSPILLSQVRAAEEDPEQHPPGVLRDDHVVASRVPCGCVTLFPLDLEAKELQVRQHLVQYW